MSTSERYAENTAESTSSTSVSVSEEPGTPVFVRLQVEVVVEVTDLEALTGTALEAVAAEYEDVLPDVDDDGTDQERRHAESLVRADAAEALASLIDPFDLVGAVPGVEIAQASWSSETVEHDPDADYEDDEPYEDRGDAYDAYDDDEEGARDDEDAPDRTGTAAGVGENERGHDAGDRARRPV